VQKVGNLKESKKISDHLIPWIYFKIKWYYPRIQKTKSPLEIAGILSYKFKFQKIARKIHP
jgi:hypothetical protein